MEIALPPRVVIGGRNATCEHLAIWVAQPLVGERAPETWYEWDVVLAAEGRWVVALVEHGPVLARWSWDLLRFALPTAPSRGGFWMLDDYGGAWVRLTMQHLQHLARRGHL